MQFLACPLTNSPILLIRTFVPLSLLNGAAIQANKGILMTAKDLYTEVTSQIVNALEAGNLPPWRKPWVAGGGFLPLRHSGVAYRGVNTIILWIQAELMGYASSTWLTFKQAIEYGGCVKKGEKSTAILWCEPITKKDTADDGTEGEERFWISKVYRVFNADQCSGLPEKFQTKPEHPLDPSQRIEHADTFIKNTAAVIKHAGGSAYYRPSDDTITLPPFESFESPEGYAGTALHELSHWTGAMHRLGRIKCEKPTKDEYAREEIVAELSSVFVCAALGIAPADMGEHAAYIKHWVAAMKEDPKYLFSAASKAQASADYLFGLQPKD